MHGQQKEQHRRSDHDRRRHRLEHAVQRETDELDRVGERIGERNEIEQLGAALAQLPERIERRREEEHREHHEIHGAGEILHLPDIDRQEQPQRAQHQPGRDERREDVEPAADLESHVERNARRETRSR